MIILLYGQDTYRSKQKLREIVGGYKKSHQSGLNFIKIDFEQNDFQDFKQTIDTVSMFDEKKLIIIEEVFSQSEYFQEELLDYLKKKKLDSDKDNIIVFWVEEVDAKNKLFQFLKKKVRVQEFELLQPHKLKEWIKKYTGEQDGDIENQAVEKLVNYIGNDLWRMSNEINKLISFSGEGKEVKVEDVEKLVKPDIDINIFNIIDALGEKNKKQALKLIHDYFKKGEDAHYLLNRFVYQFRNLIKVKSEGGKDLHPFVAKKTGQQARNFSFQELKKIYSKLFEIDLNIKTGKVDTKTALEMFVVKL